MNLVTTYFSATYTTRKIVRSISAAISKNDIEYDITNDAATTIVELANDDMLIVGVPVYAGRVPTIAAERLQRFRGEGTPAVIVTVYGNRDYDDALLELHDIITKQGFRVVAAGAFIAQHSIFPAIGANRPDERDLNQIVVFAHRAKEISSQEFGEIEIKGNYPYKTPGSIPIWPTASRRCEKCGICAKLCPAEAIDSCSPRGVDKEKCIKCGRCVVVCPRKFRHFRGVKYMIASRRFKKAFSRRREPECFYAE